MPASVFILWVAVGLGDGVATALVLGVDAARKTGRGGAVIGPVREGACVGFGAHGGELTKERGLAHGQRYGARPEVTP